MQKVLIIGGGLAGLSSAVNLAERNVKTLLIEAGNRLGGRVSSFYDNQIGEVIDNGQHIMMGCYKETLRYLKIINAEQNFFYQNNLEVVFYNSGRKYPLKVQPGLYPLNLLQGLLSFKLLNPGERGDLVKFFLKLPVSSTRDIIDYSAEQWLVENDQGENLRNIFWNTFIIGALNTTPSNASALTLRSVLLKVFFTGNKSSAIIIPAKPLTEAFCTPAVGYLLSKKSEVNCSERAVKLLVNHKNSIISVITNKRNISGFSHVICAVPLYILKKIAPGVVGEFNLQYSPILTVHFKTGRELFKEKFIAVTNSPVHWIFKHASHYTIVISSAEEFSAMDNKEIENRIKKELFKQFTIAESDIVSFKVIKEKRATFIPDNTSMYTRPGNLTNYKNLFLAGDWTNTGLPGTIEGAILSGRSASENLF
jgi:hydroxysqualene dehydroxylase